MVEASTFPAGGIQNMILNGKGDRSYERIARDGGSLFSSKRIQQLATTPMKSFPDPGTIRGLAKALRCSNRAVVLACAESLMIEVSGEESSSLERSEERRVGKECPV